MKEIEIYSDEVLVEEIKAGQVFAFDLLYRRYGPPLYRFIHSLVKAPTETENVLQDVFLQFWQNRHRLVRGEAVKSYLFTAAYHQSVSMLRRKTKEANFVNYLHSLQEVVDESNQLLKEEEDQSGKILAIVNQLPERQKEVFLLHHLDGMNYRDIAQKLHLSENTIETHMSRALKAVRQKIGK